MSGTYANLEDALKRIAELEQHNEELRYRLEKAEKRVEQLEAVINFRTILDKRLGELGGSFCEACGVHESKECKLDCEYQAMRNAEDEAWAKENESKD